MEELKIVYLPFASLIPSVHNSNTHSPEQVAQIANSIKQFGFNMPIAIDEKRNIIAGEGRYLAAKTLNRKKVPTVTLSHLTESQRRAYIIADNQIARNSYLDPEKLSKEIGDLINLDFNISTLGFSNDELLEILKDTSGHESVVAVSGHTRTTKKEETVSEGKGKHKQLAVLVMCSDADHQEDVFRQLTEQGLECKNTVL